MDELLMFLGVCFVSIPMLWVFAACYAGIFLYFFADTNPSKPIFIFSVVIMVVDVAAFLGMWWYVIKLFAKG